MAITIRTGANGSYKSAYTAYFRIYNALKAGRVVVTNIEGMQPLSEIEKLMGVEFPSTSRLFRITSRDESGVFLWTHFFCWCPLGALIVIDECQDIYSKNIGFDMKKVKYKPLEEFITKDGCQDGLLPAEYKNFFYSRYVPADMSALEASETDDRGVAEYDEQGRIIYPHTFNEGFMRHRKYNWDIELLSPDWKQIDSGIKACGEQNFYHKGRDQFFWAVRKPFIWKHDKSVSTPVIPKTKDVNLTTQKIPLDAFLLYKSTSTGVAKKAGAMNTLFRNPKVIGVFLLFFLCMGWAINEISNRFVSTDETNTQTQASQLVNASLEQTQGRTQTSNQGAGLLRDGRDSNQVNNNGYVSSVYIGEILPLEGIQKAFVTGVNHAIKIRSNKRHFEHYISVEAVASDGIYSINQDFFKAYDITYQVLDECLLKLTRDDKSKVITCKPLEVLRKEKEVQSTNLQLF
ncbi:zonular occludens toxin domain-containing protein [Vibrio atypicus]|uniref:zonular occludens toxin domain-containing protein n=1 Tax=Vibrio atypicus TaxID=558271 RepID=UPI00135C0B8D|nr:zonular occludens toxin domain-containing protein [Vibrio atypicus]